jgi:phosphopantetheinyl transferase
MINTLFDFHHLSDEFSGSRRDRRQAMRACSRLRLADLLTQVGASSIKLIRDDSGLHPADGKFFCSVSYTENIVASALSYRPIGIDIEAISERRDWQKIGNFLWREVPKTLEDFYFRFGVMEAWGKLKGIGIHSHSRRITISGSTILSPDFPNDSWRFISQQQNDLNFCAVFDEQHMQSEQEAAIAHQIETQLNALGVAMR